MNIDDFLKPKQVRFIANDKHRWELTNGKVYDVIGATYGRLKIHNDNGGNSWYDMDCFELVIESVEKLPQGAELTPEFETEASEPKFKVGDKVYKYGETDVKTVLKVFEDGYMHISNYSHEVNHETTEKLRGKRSESRNYQCFSRAWN